MKIAVVGGGIAGLASAWLLRERADVRLFEAGARLGGHSKTVDAPGKRGPIPVDVGFIVYNERTYPNLTRFFSHLGVRTELSDMSFSVSLEDGAFEWSGASLRGVFAQPANMAKLSFWRMLKDVRRFNLEAGAWLRDPDRKDAPLAEWLAARGFDDSLARRYLLPMAAAIWSAPSAAVSGFSAEMFLRFFDNHGLLTIASQPRWRTVSGGSRRYVDRVAAELGDRAQTNAAVIGARRGPGGVWLEVEGREPERFDHVIFAAHSDQSRALARDLDDEEDALLRGFPYQPNRAVLHRDPRFMPKRRAAWASWNALGARDDEPTRLTYWMNKLQNLEPETPLFVSLNPASEPEGVIGSHRFAHPAFDAETPMRQAAMDGIQGRGGYWWAGAWLGYGFHEDGLVSALRVAGALGAAPPWRAQATPLNAPSARRAA